MFTPIFYNNLVARLDTQKRSKYRKRSSHY